MTTFTLDPRLAADCHVIGWIGSCHLLLADAAELPWFIVVPETDETELADLPEALQIELLEHARTLSHFIRGHFSVDKLNVAAIGNVVSQLHLHVVGRRRDDYCWPGVVWGAPGASARDAGQVAAITDMLRNAPDIGFTDRPALGRS